MYKILRKVSRLRVFRLVISGLRASTFIMVRYFENPYDDYNPNVDFVIDRKKLLKSITEQVNTICKQLEPERKNVEGGLYVGVTGVAFMFYKLSKITLAQYSDMYVTKGREYLEPALSTSAGDVTSFLLGDAGTYAVGAVLLKRGGDKRHALMMHKFQRLYDKYLKIKFLGHGADELFVGRAGYIAATLWMRRELQVAVLSNSELHKLCNIIVASGREYAAQNKTACPLMYHYYDTNYLGAAHGISFILQILITVPKYLDSNPVIAKDIKTTIEYVAKLQADDGNWPSCLEEAYLKEHELVHWCHGAPGIVYLMAKAYLVFGDPLFYTACVKAGEVVWRKGLLRKGPGICHGVAGNAYVFMMLYRLTNDPKYIYRANCFAEFMATRKFQQEARHPDNPMSLYEGLAGTVCFLADLSEPDIAEFPFQDVFTTY